MINADIILKIKKLFALGESSNEHEAMAAMLMAQELLIKHKISLKEIEDHREINVVEQETNIRFTKAKWKGSLANLIADNFGCYSFSYTQGTHTIAFLGKDEDVEICNIVIEYAIDSINSVVKRLRYQYQKEGYSIKGLENDYALGFITGLAMLYEKQKQENQEWGLVLVKEQEVMDAYKNIQFKGTVKTDPKFKGFEEVYYQGIKDGENFSISNKIAGSMEAEEVLELVTNL